ncbi:hypothetical protein CALVIDRAFT_561700 [Calocera viscosa TUFC12733]|uniref:Uncharacterized protein n=1 Tax=Calocera viscosa (strain TUFC12733) TaxID=1330018 RepID=A0A167PG00_CALVF|nr:hypothetical protein CALVIDRAFT_561700 [Calocera viscosa TUFC12733]
MQFLRTLIVVLFAIFGLAVAVAVDGMSNAERLARGLPPAPPHKLARAGPRAPSASVDDERSFAERAGADGTVPERSHPSGIHHAHPQRRAHPSGFPHHYM